MDTVSTRCEVKITTPAGYKISFSTLQPQGDLISVSTSKDLGEICGSFTLEFAPRVVDGKTWDERIPMRSLVEIRMERPGNAGKLPQVNSTVMVGLTDDHARSEQYQAANPTRSITISGREISGILLDATLFFHQMLLKSSAEGAGGGIQGAGENIFGLGALGVTLAWQPDILKNGITPIENLAAILEYFIFGGGTTASSNATTTNPNGTSELAQAAAAAKAAREAPKTATPPRESVINLYLPDRPLNQILVLNKDQWTTFQPCEVSIGQNSVAMSSIYNYCQICIDPAFQEFFTRVEDGVSKIHFRGKPFKQTKVTKGSRFDDSATTCQTLTLDPSWLMNAQLRRNSQAIYNIFWVKPMGTWNMLDSTAFGYLAKPATIIDPKHPSSLIRYGIRLMQVNSPYLPAYGLGQPGNKDIAAPGQLTGAPGGPVPTGVRIPTQRLKINQAAVATMAAQVAREEGVPEPMIPSFLANMQVESGFDNSRISKKGAIGLGQLMPKTAAGLGVNPNDPVDNARGSARYWRQLIKKYGHNPALVAGAYNAGPGAVPVNGPLPSGAGYLETRNHSAKVVALQGNYASNGTPTATVTTPPPAAPTAPAPKETPPPPTSGITALAEKWSGILEAWYDHGGQLSVGSFTVRGHPAWNIGHRLVLNDTRGEREFYIEGVAHNYDMRNGMYTTNLRVTRGWYLDGKTDEQESDAAPAASQATPVADEEPIVTIPNPLTKPMKIILR